MTTPQQSPTEVPSASGGSHTPMDEKLLHQVTLDVFTALTRNRFVLVGTHSESSRAHGLSCFGGKSDPGPENWQVYAESRPAQDLEAWERLWEDCRKARKRASKFEWSKLIEQKTELLPYKSKEWTCEPESEPCIARHMDLVSVYKRSVLPDISKGKAPDISIVGYPGFQALREYIRSLTNEPQKLQQISRDEFNLRYDDENFSDFPVTVNVNPTTISHIKSLYKLTVGFSNLEQLRAFTKVPFERVAPEDENNAGTGTESTTSHSGTRRSRSPSPSHDDL